jgi:multicomponent Na+:H+ antiporter subunit D
LVSIQCITALPVGCVSLLKITAYVFGSALHEAVWAGRVLLVLVGISLCVAALVALSKQDMRERLVYSCLSQALCAILGACLAIPAGAFAAALQIVAFSSAGAVLFMAAGAVHAVTGRTSADLYPGMGRLMPWSIGAFALGAASMIGLPPFSGAWAKLWLITAAADAGWISASITAAVGAVLTFAHLGPLTAHALGAPAPPVDAMKRPDGASILLTAPVVIAAAATLSLLFYADPLAVFLAPMWSAPP